MQQDRAKWNQKYQNGSHPDAPAAIVKQYVQPANGKKALDIAAGNGRNALFLADQGYVVDAIDIADAGLSLFAGRHSRINAICADLDHFNIAANRYDLIVNIKFLNRRLFPYILAGLTLDGMLIFQTFVGMPDCDAKPPGCADYYLRPNELLHAFLALRILRYTEAEAPSEGEDVRLASLVAIKTC